VRARSVEMSKESSGREPNVTRFRTVSDPSARSGCGTSGRSPASGTVAGVASEVVLINGLPGAGKTTLAGHLAVEVGAQLLSKDGIKEALAGMPSAPTVVPQLGAIAMDTLWALAGAIPGTVVIESFWFRPRNLPFAEAGLKAVAARSVVEVWCDVPAELARSRYARRTRHSVHEDGRRLAEDWAIWPIKPSHSP
jgi:predicted kinase